MDATPAPSGDSSVRLRRSWLNTDGADGLRWPTAADYLHDLQIEARRYQRKAQRRQRLSFADVLQLRRLLYCLGEMQTHRGELSMPDRTAFDQAGERLNHAFAELAAADHLNPETLLTQVHRRLSPEWTGFLAAHVGTLHEHLYVVIHEDARYFTARCRSKARSTTEEVDHLVKATSRLAYWRLRSPADAEEGRQAMDEAFGFAHARIMRIVEILRLRFGVPPATEADTFWHQFRQRVVQGATFAADPRKGGAEDNMEQTIRKLLRTVPETWSEYDPNRHTDRETRALFLLVAAGMVERKGRFRLRQFNHPIAAEVTWRATGEGGFGEVVKRICAAMWPEWKGAYLEWKAGETADTPLDLVELLKPDEWRLTTEGVQARADLDDPEHAACALDFVLRRGLFDGRPRPRLEGGQFRGIWRREPVFGEGQLLSLKKVRVEDTQPMGVNVANWREGAEVFKDMFAELAVASTGTSAGVGVSPTPSAPRRTPDHKEATGLPPSPEDDSDAQFIRRPVSCVTSETDAFKDLRDWEMRVEAALRDDRWTANPLMTAVYRPHEAADSALIRLSFAHPEPVALLRANVAECDAVLARCGKEDPVTLNRDLADWMGILARRIRDVVDTASKTRGTANASKTIDGQADNQNVSVPVDRGRPPKWTPPPGFVGTKDICNDERFKKDGKSPPRTTIDVWLNRARATGEEPKTIKAPDTGELFLPVQWVSDQITRWNPRRP